MSLARILVRLLALTGCMLPLANAHKESAADRWADKHENFDPHTWPEMIVNRMVSRKKIDVHFRQDLYDICDKHHGTRPCRVAAKVYYAGVRLWAGNRENAYVIIDAIVANIAPAKATTTTATAPAKITPRNAAYTDAVTINTHLTNATAANDTQVDTGGKERIVFMAWLHELTSHPERLMTMSEKELAYVSKSLDAWMEVIEQE
ncbi:hypothetical protein G6011_02017 [Alternaria panax]|uniref:Uncharacterized protein n=1 Tax=Alternaria panax TaxID=48097 RepID=A0AAD4FCS4_9PLEO|nr:hypothetical protein G6011_02017 [Alternaria panax]